MVEDNVVFFIRSKRAFLAWFANVEIAELIDPFDVNTNPRSFIDEAISIFVEYVLEVLENIMTFDLSAFIFNCHEWQ